MEYIHSFILQAKNRVKWDEEKSHTVKMTEAMYLKNGKTFILYLFL